MRDLTGRGLHFTRVTRQFHGLEFRHWDRWPVDIDLHVPPGAEVDFPCGHALWARGGGPARLWSLTETRRYAGSDGDGHPAQLEIALPFGDMDASPSPAPLLFFAGFTASLAPLTTNPPCEFLAARRTVFDLTEPGPIHFLVGVDNERGHIPSRHGGSAP